MKKTVREILNNTIREVDQQMGIADLHQDHLARFNLQLLRKRLVDLRSELS